MRRTLLLSVAAASLVAGIGIVGAQPGPSDHKGTGAAGINGASRNQTGSAGAERHGTTPGNPRETTGQGTSEQRGPGAEPRSTGRSETTGQSGVEEHGRAPGKGSRPQTTGQGGGAQEKQGQGKKSETTGQGGAQSPGRSGAAGETGAGGPTRGEAAESGRSGGGNAHPEITTEQRTRIRETVLKEHNVPRVAHVNFSLAVGTVVPRDVHVVPMPTTIIEIYPAWRGYDYLVVGEEIIVIDPRNHTIVAIIT
jgi:hypothetical protein